MNYCNECKRDLDDSWTGGLHGKGCSKYLPPFQSETNGWCGDRVKVQHELPIPFDGASVDLDQYRLHLARHVEEIGKAIYDATLQGWQDLSIRYKVDYEYECVYAHLYLDGTRRPTKAEKESRDQEEAERVRRRKQEFDRLKKEFGE